MLAVFVLLQIFSTQAQASSDKNPPSIQSDRVNIQTAAAEPQGNSTDASPPIETLYPEPRTSTSLTEEESRTYWIFVQQQVRLRNFERAIPILKLLSTASGVPESIRDAADKTRLSLYGYVRPIAQNPSDNNELAKALVASEKKKPRSDFSLDVELGELSNDDKEFRGSNKASERILGAELTLSHKYQFNRFFSTKVELEVSVEKITDEAEEKFSREISYLNFDFSSHLIDKELRIGTQTIADDRGWWWDDELDLVALSASTDNWSLAHAIGVQSVGRLFKEDVDIEDRDILRLFGNHGWKYHDAHSIALLYLVEYDQSSRQSEGATILESAIDKEDNRIGWLGMSYFGEFFADSNQPIDYWFDFAAVYGKTVEYDFDDIENQSLLQITDKVEKSNIKGWGLDLGTVISTDFPGSLEFKLGFATTSTDKVENSNDRTFRQSGLQDNDYGLILEPELSNLTILTFGVEFEPVSDVTVAIFFYDFRQVIASDKLRKADVKGKWNGQESHIGRELDIELEISIWDPLELSFSFGIFEAGDAAGSDNIGNTVQQGLIELSYEFF